MTFLNRPPQLSSTGHDNCRCTTLTCEDGNGTAEPFQLWTLQVNADQTGTLTCEDGNGAAVFTKRLDYTDFPLPTIRL